MLSYLNPINIFIFFKNVIIWVINFLFLTDLENKDEVPLKNRIYLVIFRLIILIITTIIFFYMVSNIWNDILENISKIAENS